MSGQRMLQRIHVAGELYRARGGRVSCGGRPGRGLDQVKMRSCTVRLAIVRKRRQRFRTLGRATRSCSSVS